MEHRCTQCGKFYSEPQYRSLEKVPIEEGKEEQYGYEKVCGRCGKGFHSEKWQLVDHANGAKVSTVGLSIRHGLKRNHWYETCIFRENGGSEVMERYETKKEARKGHERHITQRLEWRESQLKEGFEFEEQKS